MDSDSVYRVHCVMNWVNPVTNHVNSVTKSVHRAMNRAWGVAMCA